MKVSQNWLKKLVEINSTPDVLSEKLSIGGFEVESLEDCSKNVDGVVLGKVLSVLNMTDLTNFLFAKSISGPQRIYKLSVVRTILNQTFMFMLQQLVRS